MKITLYCSKVELSSFFKNKSKYLLLAVKQTAYEPCELTFDMNEILRIDYNSQSDYVVVVLKDKD